MGRGWRTTRLGIKSLMLHKLRSSLTMLGMLFGVASVIAMLAVGEGANYAALEQIKAMGPTNLMVRSQRPPVTEESSSGSRRQVFAYGLTYRDADRITALFPHAEHVVPVRETPSNVRIGQYWSSSIAVGTDQNYLDVMNLEVAEGRWLSSIDLDGLENVAVLGAEAARTLSPIETPVGESVQVDRYRFTVVGVLEPMGRSASPGGVPLDQCVFVPRTTSRSRFGDTIYRQSRGSSEYTHLELAEIKVKLRDTDEVLSSADVLSRLLGIGERNQDDVKLVVPLELLRQREKTARMFNIVLGSIAVISLLVGGIGIMNVMLATVTERTREIGIRRALGAKKGQIIQQFLVETAVLSAAGGLLGIGIGIVIPEVVTAVSDNLTIVRIEHVMLSFGISAGVGVAFGIYPAWRAANMDPVECLRHS